MRGKDLYRALLLVRDGVPCTQSTLMWHHKNQEARALMSRMASLLGEAALPYSGELVHALYCAVVAPDSKPFEQLSAEVQASYTRVAQILTCEQALARFWTVLAHLVRITGEEEASDGQGEHDWVDRSHPPARVGGTGRKVKG